MLCASKTLYGFSIDTIFTTLITIFIFVIGYIINRIIENRKEAKRLKELEKYFLFLLDTQLEPINKQINSLNELADSISSKKHQNYIFKEIHNLNIDNNIQDLSKQDLYKIFITNKKTDSKEKFKHYNSILNAIDFIQLQKDRIRKNFISFFENYCKYQDQWDSYGETILRHFDIFISFARANKIKPGDDPFIKELDSLVYTWSKEEDSKEIYVAREKLIDPLREFCKKYKSDLRSNVLRPFILNSIYAFNNLESLKGTYSKQFSGESEKLNGFKNSLEKAINHFMEDS